MTGVSIPDLDFYTTNGWVSGGIQMEGGEKDGVEGKGKQKRGKETRRQKGEGGQRKERR